VIGIPVTWGTCVVLPGYALWRFTRPLGDDPIETITRVLLNGLIFLFVLCFAWAITHVSLDAFRAALPILLIAMCAAVPRRDRSRIEVIKPRLRRYEKQLLILFAALAVMPAIGVAITGPPINITSDTIDHAGYVAEIARTGHAFPSTAIYLAPGADGQDFRKGLLHAVYGLFARHTGASPIDVFAVVGAFLLVTMTFVVYTSARSLLRHRVAAVVAGVFFLAGSDWGIGSEMVRAAFYSNRFGAAFLLMFIAEAIEYMHRGPKVALRWCAVFAFAAAAVHIQYAIVCGAAAGVMLLWKTCSPCKGWDEHFSRALRVMLAAIAGSLPYTMYRFFTAYQTNPLHAQVQDAVFVTPRGSSPIRCRCGETSGCWDYLALLHQAVVGPSPERPGVGYAIAAMLTFLAIEFVPFILTRSTRCSSTSCSAST
jgi:hypothetical protein